MKEKLIQRWEELNQDRHHVDREYVWPIVQVMIRIRIVLANRYNYTVNKDL